MRTLQDTFFKSIILKTLGKSVTEVDEIKLIKIMEAIFRSHGFDAKEEEGWVLPTGTYPAVKAFWYPEATESVGQLTIEIFINEKTTIIESFAGIGEKKFESALENFINNALQLYLSAFWGYDAKSISIDTWELNGEAYLAFIGDYGVINTKDDFSIPEDYLEVIYDAIASENLGNEYHWFNFFYVNFDAQNRQAEALKENEIWESGKEALNSLDWAKVYDYYSVRQSIILKRI
ncbi:MAG: Unknown protein [uncultured Sulfurovum sp.]|uniref:Uncharacterized protein n=1 Tax=uncultured Sulfurovum sp. TaxID=269237 RepID=A0A6S6U0M5_9BACT|nr:MAG: Unknown protein [uncultured Sulfurovum sp.]